MVTEEKLLVWERKQAKVKRLEREKNWKGEKKKGQGLLLGKNSPFSGILILGSIL